MKREAVTRVLRQIDNAVNRAIEANRTAEATPDETPEEKLRRRFREDPPTLPSHLPIKSDLFPHGFVWEQSVDIAWRFFARFGEFFVSHSGGDYEKVTSPDFGTPPRSISLANEYFDLATGKTTKDDFDVSDKRGGAVGESVFVRIDRLGDLIEAIERGEPETFFQERPDAPRGRRPLQEDAKRNYDKVFPEGHGALTMKAVVRRVEDETGFVASVKTFQRALKKK